MKLFIYKHIMFLCVILPVLLSACSEDIDDSDFSEKPYKELTLKIMQTSDIHGNLFPTDILKSEQVKGSISRISSYVKEQRTKYANNCILLDNGDVLQGHPSVYYYNFIDTTKTHVAADVLNYLNYDASTLGNHDIEAGPDVYYRYVKQCGFPVLGANIINKETNHPAFEPYTIIKRDSVKIAVLGMITPAIPSWLSAHLWGGMCFSDIEECAREWIPIIKQKEQPDLIIGLFHAGTTGNIIDGVKENPCLEVAKNVPGFDILLTGHSHVSECVTVENIYGDSVLIMNPGSNGEGVSDIEATFFIENGEVVKKELKGVIVPMDNYAPDNEFLEKFKNEYVEIEGFVSEVIGNSDSAISSIDAYFAPSMYVDLVHRIMMEETGADISINGLSSLKYILPKGDIKVGDVFRFYKYENYLYTMSLTGQEIKDYLELSYHMWTAQMSSPEDDFLLFNDPMSNNERLIFVHPFYSFDSAFGINYTVDVSKPKGAKVNVLSMADGAPFELNKTYSVAINSYKGNGGLGMLIDGAGIAKEKLKDRIIACSEKDIRYYIIDYIERNEQIRYNVSQHWKFIPEELVKVAIQRDRALLENIEIQ